MDLNLSRTLIQSGLTWKEVKVRTGITQALYGQIKRDQKVRSKHKNFGCVVCNGEKVSKLFCPKHYWTYIESARSRKRRKAV